MVLVSCVSPKCPVSCNSYNSCVEVSCSEDTNYECQRETLTNCCGNAICEENESFYNCSFDCELPDEE